MGEGADRSQSERLSERLSERAQGNFSPRGVRGEKGRKPMVPARVFFVFFSYLPFPAKSPLLFLSPPALTLEELQCDLLYAGPNTGLSRIKVGIYTTGQKLGQTLHAFSFIFMTMYIVDCHSRAICGR